MLTPEYIEDCDEALLGIYDNLTTSISMDIAKSIDRTGKLIGTAAYQTERLQEAGVLLQDVVNDVASYSKLADNEVRRIFEDAAKTGMVNDAKDLIKAGQLTESDLRLSAEARQALEATILKTQGDLRNLTMTTASSAYDIYLRETNNAYMKVVNGGYAQEKAIADAVKNAADEGAWVNYGVKSDGSVNHARLDVAVRRSVQTGVNQTCGKITEMWAEDMDCQYFEVDAHIGARPSHQEWEGQVYKIEGSDENYENFYEATGYGDVDGLCGINCAHSFYPFWPGISERNYTEESLRELQDVEYEYEGETYSAYECSQIQRGFEREIRESKRELACYDAVLGQSGLSEKQEEEYRARFNWESSKLKETESEMKKFCEATNRNVDSARTQVVAFKDEETGRVLSWDRSLAQEAVWAAK